MRVLVTGAAGFVGANVVRQLIAGGHEAVAVVRPGSPVARLAELRDRCAVVELDVGDVAGVRSVLGLHQPDAVVHLAWYTEPGRYRHAVAENVASLMATAGLLAAAAEHGCRRVVLGGSCLEHAVAAERPIYDAAKIAVHRLAEGFAGEGVSVACGHIFYTYGPFEDARRVVPAVIRSVLAGQPIGATTGEQTRDYLYVEDVATGFIALAASTVSGGADLCSGSLLTLAEVLRVIGEETGRPDLIRIGERGPAVESGYPAAGDPNTLYAIGWRPRFDLQTGIRETIAWWTARQEAYP